HTADRGEAEESERVVVAVFPVLGKAAASVEPGDGPLNDPAFGFDDKAFGTIRAFDNLDRQAAHRFGGAVSEDRSGIGAVGEQFAQERELSEQGGRPYRLQSLLGLNVPRLPLPVPPRLPQ